MPLLKLTPAQQTKMAQTICQEIAASDAAKGQLPERWKQNEKIYNVDPDATNLSIADNMQPYNIPLYRQKADRIIGQITSSITGVSPTVQCLDDEDGDDEGNNDSDLERGLDAIAQDGRFNTIFKQAVKLAVNTNIGTIRVRPLVKGRSVYMEPIRPQKMICYPAENGNYEEAKTLGHKFQLVKYKIEAKQKSKEYYDFEVMGDGGYDDHRDGPKDLTVPTTPVQPEDEMVSLAEVIHECDLEGKGEYKRYLCVVATDMQKLLRCEPYPYSFSWYFDIRLDECGDNVWPNDSVAQIMQGVQLAYSDIHTTLIHGSYMAAFPIVVVSGGSLSVKAKKYGPATIIESPMEVKVQALTSGFNPGALPNEAAELEHIADALTGISQLGTSENLPSGTTATAANALVQAQNERQDQYTESISPSIERIWMFLYELLQMHYDEIRAVLRNRFPAALTYDKIRDKTFRFEVTGRTGASSNTVLLQKIQMLIGLAQNPQSDLDYKALESKIVQLMDFPWSTASIKKLPVPDQLMNDIMQVLQAVATGQATPEQAAQAILQDIQTNGPQQRGNGALLPPTPMEGSPVLPAGIEGPGTAGLQPLPPEPQ